MKNSPLIIPHTTQTQTQENQLQNEDQSPPSDNIDDDDQEKARCEWDFSLTAVISSSTAAAAGADAIGAVEFDQSNSLLATGGIARRIRIYRAEKLSLSRENIGHVSYLDHADACDFYMCTPARLSSLKWKPGSGSRVIGSGDYDGLILEHDLETRAPVFERDEHSGRRVWALDYSGPGPSLGASGSDDGTVQMWDARCGPGQSAGSVSPNPAQSPVCSVEFSPFDGHAVAVGCADRKVYGYDVRRLAGPVFVLDRHEKAVTYTRFVDSQTIVSSSIDGCMIMWDVGDKNPIRVFRGHVNSERFVGLSVWRNGGLLSCGSEDNRVYVYDMRWGDPIWTRGFAPEGRVGWGFVSGVCWRQTAEERCALVAGGSDGVLQVFEGEKL